MRLRHALRVRKGRGLILAEWRAGVRRSVAQELSRFAPKKAGGMLTMCGKMRLCAAKCAYVRIVNEGWVWVPMNAAMTFKEWFRNYFYDQAVDKEGSSTARISSGWLALAQQSCGRAWDPRPCVGGYAKKTVKPLNAAYFRVKKGNEDARQRARLALFESVKAILTSNPGLRSMIRFDRG